MYYFFNGLHFMVCCLDVTKKSLVDSSKDLTSIVRHKKPSLFEQNVLSVRANLFTQNCTQLASKIQKASSLDSALARKITSIKEKVSVSSKWRSIGLDERLLQTDYDGVTALLSTRIIYTIVGLSYTSKEGKVHLLEVDDNGKIWILVKDQKERTSNLIDRFHYQESKLQIVDTKDRGYHYLLPDGLQQADSFAKHHALIPITKLTSNEMKRLLQHASQMESLTFTEDNPASAVFQIVTNPRKVSWLPNISLLKGLHELCDENHVTVRVIDKDGNVFSSGLI